MQIYFQTLYVTANVYCVMCVDTVDATATSKKKKKKSTVRLATGTM